jgi:ribose transport system substrate-binding protein
MRFFSRVVLTVLMAFAVTFSASAQGSAKKELTIGVANFISSAAYFVGMPKAIQREAAKFTNIKIISTDAKGDVSKLTSDIADLINRGVDGLIVSSGPVEAVPAALDAIERSKIPTVFVDRLWQNTKLSQPWNWVGAPNVKMGREIGEYIRKVTKGSGTVVIIKGGPADNSIGIDRTKGFLEGLGKGYTVNVAQNYGGWGDDGGFKVMEDLLAKYNKIDVVFAENDSMALGAQKAIADAGRSKKIIVTASDAGKATLLEMMKPDSNYVATAVNDSDEIGTTGFYHLLGLLAGAQLPNLTPTEGALVLKEDAFKIYDPNKVF